MFVPPCFPAQFHLPLFQQHLTEHETDGVQFWTAMIVMIANCCSESTPTANSAHSEIGRPRDSPTADEEE